MIPDIIPGARGNNDKTDSDKLGVYIKIYYLISSN
jgi:hypothetical protein